MEGRQQPRHRDGPNQPPDRMSQLMHPIRVTMLRTSRQSIYLQATLLLGNTPIAAGYIVLVVSNAFDAVGIPDAFRSPR